MNSFIPELFLNRFSLLLLLLLVVPFSEGNQSAGMHPYICDPENNAPRPILLFTDILSGPNYGGEDNNGAYLSLYGFNLGDSQALEQGKLKVFIGDHEVGRYISLGKAKSQAWRDHSMTLQHLSVQVGHLGNEQPGVTLPVLIQNYTACSTEKHQFTIQQGDIYFLDNVIGNDATAQKNRIDKPWRYMQTADQGGLISRVKPGDMIILRGKKTWTDKGYTNRFARFRRITGSEPKGLAETGPITIKGYPGEDVSIEIASGSYGGFHGVNESYPEDSDWIVLSDLKILGGDRTVKDAPVNLQANSDHWRIINNEICCWAAEDGSKGAEARSGGITGNGKDIKIIGNYIHDIGGGKLNHGIYLDTGANDVEIAYNHIANIKGGNVIQTYDNLGDKNLKELNIHHNLLENGNRYGLNISEGTASASISNNIIRNISLAGIRLASTVFSNLMITNNTVINTNLNDNNGVLQIDENMHTGNIYISNNILVSSSASRAIGYYENSEVSGLKLVNNVFSDRPGLFNQHLKEEYPDNIFCKNDRMCNGVETSTRNACDCKIIDKASKYKLNDIFTDFYMTGRPCGLMNDIGAVEYCKTQ